jgi:hypothetical protein
MNRFLSVIAVCVLLAGCATPAMDERPAHALPEQLQPFSNSGADGLPSGWVPLVILRNRSPTQYQLVQEERRMVLHARADGSSSALMHDLRLDIVRQPWLRWQWKIKGLASSIGRGEWERPSPVRIILGFEGDKESLPFSDQILFETAKVVTGHDFPYATLMYVWGESAAPGTILDSRHSRRIKLVVAESGDDGIGTWRQFSRNVVEDFYRAFGEQPGRLIGIGVLTDADELEQGVEAWYGDIVLSHEPWAAAEAPELPASSASNSAK